MLWNLGKRDSKYAYSSTQCYGQYRCKRRRGSVQFGRRTKNNSFLKNIHNTGSRIPHHCSKKGPREEARTVEIQDSMPIAKEHWFCFQFQGGKTRSWVAKLNLLLFLSFYLSFSLCLSSYLSIHILNIDDGVQAPLFLPLERGDIERERESDVHLSVHTYCIYTYICTCTCTSAYIMK